MKKLVLLLGLCTVISSCVYAEETTSTVLSPTEEINSSFSQRKNNNWFSVKKPKSGNELSASDKKQEHKPSIFNKFNNDDKLIKQINEDSGKSNGVNDWADIKKPTNTDNNSANSNLNNKTSTNKEKTKPQKNSNKEDSVKKEAPKETVHTTKSAEKIINSEKKEAEKEEKIKINQEQEKERYRELQALTQQYQQAVALYNDNNIDEALAVFSQIPEDKRPAEAWLLIGNILLDKDKKDEAVFMYGRAILTDSKFYKSYYNLGNVYLADDKFNMAIEQYKIAIKYAPNNPYIFYNLGCAYIKSGELKKAKSAFIKAIELNSNIADFHYNLAYVYKKLNKEKMAKIYLENYNKLTGEI